MEKNMWENTSEMDYEKAEQELKAVEKQLEEEMEKELAKYLDKAGQEWWKGYQAKHRLLESGKEMVFFMKGWKAREKLGC